MDDRPRAHVSASYQAAGRQERYGPNVADDRRRPWVASTAFISTTAAPAPRRPRTCTYVAQCLERRAVHRQEREHGARMHTREVARRGMMAAAAVTSSPVKRASDWRPPVGVGVGAITVSAFRCYIHGQSEVSRLIKFKGSNPSEELAVLVCDDTDVASSSTGKFTVTVRYNDEIVAQFIRQAGQWLSYYTVLSFAW